MKPPTTIEIDRILQILPHRWPFVLVDRVTHVEPGERILGHKCVTMGEPWFQGHFPARPIMPGVLIIEALAQAGALLAASLVGFDPEKQVIFFLGIDKARFRKPVTPGDLLMLEVVPLRKGGAIWKLRGEAKVDGAVVAEAELMATIQKKNDV